MNNKYSFARPVLFICLLIAVFASVYLFYNPTLIDSTDAIADPSTPPSDGGQQIESQPISQQFIRYCLQARNQQEQNSPQGAAEFFTLAADKKPELADAALDEAARMYVIAGNNTAALATLQRLLLQKPNSLLAADARERMAVLYQEVGDYPRAIATHRQAATMVSTNTEKIFHQVMAAELLEKVVKRDEARNIYLDILTNQGPNRYTMRAINGFHRTNFAGNAAAQAAHAETLGLKYYAADAFQQAGPALDLAIELKLKLGIKPAALRDLIEKAGDSLYKTHNNDIAAKYYEMLLPLEDQKRADIHYCLGRLYTRLGNAELAQLHYVKLMSTGYRRVAAYQLNLLAIEDKQYAQAHKNFVERLKHPGGERELITWWAAWTAYRAGKLKTALNHLDQLDKFKKSSEKRRYQYWRARILLDQGEKVKALAILSSLNRSDPTDYYGWRSAEWLQRSKKPFINLQAGMDKHKADGFYLSALKKNWWQEYPELVGLDRISTLTEAKLWRTAGLAFARIERPKKLPSRESYELAQLALRSRAYNQASKIAYDAGLYGYLNKCRHSLLETYYPLRMPIGYEDYVRRYAAQFNLPPAFVLAIILNESGFRPQVVSPAYAVGLMQIMPQTGEEIAAALGEIYHEDSLYDPETNIRYGCWYLRNLLDILGNDTAYAVAAYNAGPKAVAKWLRNKSGISQEYFMAEIPYTETNRYVRKVLTAQKKYEVLLEYSSRMR